MKSLKNGLYSYLNVADGHSYLNNPYDKGVLIVKVKETNRVVILTIKEKDMSDTTYVDALFRGKKRIKIKKKDGPHGLDLRKENLLIIFPCYMGIPLAFELVKGA